MPYTLTPAASALAIAELQYASGNEVCFTTIGSNSIGVVGRKGERLTGVHLTANSADGTVFDIKAADAVAAIIGDVTHTLWIGPFHAWFARFEDAMNHIGTLLHNHGEMEVGPGIYGARLGERVLEFRNGDTYRIIA